MSEPYKRQSSPRTSVISIQLIQSGEAVIGKVLWALISCVFNMTYQQENRKTIHLVILH